MSFAKVLEEIYASRETRNGILTDGQSVCTYGEVPDLLRKIERSLAQHGFGADTVMAVECANSLPCALLVLFALQRGNSLFLTPSDSNRNEPKPTPRFCSHKLAALPLPPGAGTATSIERAFRPEPNPGYNGKPVPPGKIFVRTSGSMGASKIVVHGHEGLLGNARNCLQRYGFTPRSRAVIPVPITHMYGFGAGFLPSILSGASVDLQHKTNLLQYLDREKRFQPTIAFVTPQMCGMLLKAFKTPRTTYEVFVTSGQRIDEDTFRAFDPMVGGRLVNQYGSTEMGAIAACAPGDDLNRRATTVGSPMSGVRLRVESRVGDTGAAAASGDLYCQHPYGFEGYVDEDGEWSSRVSSESWYRTGDLATVRPDGSMLILGRADASVNRNGYLVLLSDIERVIAKLDPVAEVAVVPGQREGKLGQRIAAFCVLRPGVRLDGTQLRQRCFDVLPHFAIPDEVRVTEDLPALPSGKTDLQALAALLR